MSQTLQSTRFYTVLDQFGWYNMNQSRMWTVAWTASLTRFYRVLVQFRLYNLNQSRMWTVAWSASLTHFTCFSPRLVSSDWPHFLTLLWLFITLYGSISSINIHSFFTNSYSNSNYLLLFYTFLLSSVHDDNVPPLAFHERFLSSLRDAMNGQRTKVHIGNSHQKSVWICNPSGF